MLFALPNLHSRRCPALSRSRRKATGSLYRSPVIIMAQTILAILLASATAAIFGGRRANNAVSQGRLGSMALGISDDSQRAGHQQLRR